MIPPTPLFIVSGETKDLRAKVLQQGETKELGRKRRQKSENGTEKEVQNGKVWETDGSQMVVADDSRPRLAESSN